MRGSPPTQWLVLAIASAGWVFDVYEGQLFTVFKTSAAQGARLGSSSTAESTGTPTWRSPSSWSAAPSGVSAFGILGDRIGRVRVMSLTILAYSVFSALTFFAQSVWQVDVLRFLVALGTGGEWAIAAALVAETFPLRARAVRLGDLPCVERPGCGAGLVDRDGAQGARSVALGRSWSAWRRRYCSSGSG